MSEELLPQSSGPATRALAYTFDTYGRWSAPIQTVKDYGLSVIPDDWVPWLIYDLGLEDVIPYVRTFRQVLAEGPGWQARRGTAAGIEIGIGWVESEGKVAAPDGRHDWWKFQVGFTEPVVDLYQLTQLEGIIRLSKSSEDELFRMFSAGRDYRPARYDGYRADSGNLTDGYSGERIEGIDALVSFGWVGTLFQDLGLLAITSDEVQETDFLAWYDGMRLDVDRYGTRPGNIAIGGQDLDASFIMVDQISDTWGFFYPDDNWGAAGDFLFPVSCPPEVS